MLNDDLRSSWGVHSEILWARLSSFCSWMILNAFSIRFFILRFFNLPADENEPPVVIKEEFCPSQHIAWIARANKQWRIQFRDEGVYTNLSPIISHLVSLVSVEVPLFCSTALLTWCRIIPWLRPSVDWALCFVRCLSLGSLESHADVFSPAWKGGNIWWIWWLFPKQAFGRWIGFLLGSSASMCVSSFLSSWNWSSQSLLTYRRKFLGVRICWNGEDLKQTMQRSLWVTYNERVLSSGPICIIEG